MRPAAHACLLLTTCDGCPTPHPQATYMLGGQGDVICPDSTPNCTLEDYGAVDNSNAARYGNLFWSALPPGQGWL